MDWCRKPHDEHGGQSYSSAIKIIKIHMSYDAKNKESQLFSKLWFFASRVHEDQGHISPPIGTINDDALLYYLGLWVYNFRDLPDLFQLWYGKNKSYPSILPIVKNNVQKNLYSFFWKMT